MREGFHKKYQRELTKVIREANNSVYNDSLWRGRFYILQRSSQFYRFEDGSGGLLYADLRAYDKKTGKYKDYFIEYAPYLRTFRWKIHMDILNTFIVEDIDAWSEEPDPRSQTDDWRNIPYIQNDRRINSYFIARC